MNLFACENDPEVVRALGNPYAEIPTEVAYNVEMLYSDSGQVRVVLNAPELYRYGGKETREEFKGGITVEFLGEHLRPTSRLTAKHATKQQMTVKDTNGRNVRESVIIVKDSVVLHGSNGETMKTDELAWYEKQGRMLTDKWVHITTKDRDVLGFGFESDKEFQNWSLRSLVGEFKDKGIYD